MLDTATRENRILIIDDDPVTRKLLAQILKKNYQCEEAESAEEALQKIREKEFSIILSDIVLPKMNGVDLIPHIKSISPNTLIILVSSKQAIDYALKAFRLGAFDYITKPFDWEQIEAVVSRAIEHYELRITKEHYQAHLEDLVSLRTNALENALKEIENSYRATLKALIQALETRDFETHGHSERVVTFSLRLGHEIGLDKDKLRDLELGALLHDIGKIGVPDAILRKPAKLDSEEWVKMKLHPLHGQKILRDIPFLEEAAKVVSQHHEKWDGSGYPYALRGEEIDIGARIFAVVDAFDALISDRVYRKGRPYKEAVEEILKHSGSQFDSMIVDAFMQIPEGDWEILRQRSLRVRRKFLHFRR
jgi:putative nucleotidyltransferase with HDIG domain